MVVDEVCNDDTLESEKTVNPTEDEQKVSDIECKATAAEEAVADKDCDVYIIRYWDNRKSSEAQEALNYIEENLNLNFKKNKVKETDQVYKICAIENHKENEIEVKVKMKKDNWPVELSARNLQTSGQEGQVSVSLKNILR